MSMLGTLLRCLLIVTLCLEGSMSLWASSAMAVDNAREVGAASQTTSAVSDQDCEDQASQGGGDATHHECDCTSAGCTCACVFPVVAIVHVPFAARHLLASVPAVPSRAPVVLTATTRVFRPPIG